MQICIYSEMQMNDAMRVKIIQEHILQVILNSVKTVLSLSALFLFLAYP